MADPIDPLPPAPTREMATDREQFVKTTDTFLAALPPMVLQINDVVGDLNNLVQQSFTGTSTDSITVSLGAKIITISPDMAIVPGHRLFLASTASPANRITGLVSAYDPSNGALAIDITEIDGSGTFSDWSVGIAVDADLSGYVTLAGTQTLTNKTLTAPVIATIVNGGATLTLPTTTGTMVGRTTTDALSNKTLVNPVMQGAVKVDEFTITDGGSVSINPSDGEVQTWAMGANRTPTLSLITTGKAVLLMVSDGTGFTITLTGVTWMNNGGVAPTLKTTGFTPILLFNVGGTLYAWLCGDGG